MGVRWQRVRHIDSKSLDYGLVLVIFCKVSLSNYIDELAFFAQYVSFSVNNSRPIYLNRIDESILPALRLLLLTTGEPVCWQSHLHFD